MKNSIFIIALLLVGNMAFAGKLTVDKAIVCFAKSLKSEAYTAAWFDGGKKQFIKKVKNNENYPVLGDQLSLFVSAYLSDAAFKSNALGTKSMLSKKAADANRENTVAAALTEIQQYIEPSMITDKGKKMMAKYQPALQALAGKS